MENPEILKSKYPVLKFSYNWNKKLDCKSFSTVRIANPSKYVLLDIYEIILETKKDEQVIFKGLARLQAQHHFLLHQVSPAISFLDANLTTIDFQKLIMTMYKHKKIDFRKQMMSFLVFQYLKPTEPEMLELQQKLAEK